MESSRTFTDLLVWQKAHSFVLKVYRTTSVFPEFERFGLLSQFTRAAVSIPANIAEGYKKIGQRDKLRFMNVAQGSLEESRYYIILSKDLNYISANDYSELMALLTETSRLLSAYMRGIENKSYQQ